MPENQGKKGFTLLSGSDKISLVLGVFALCNYHDTGKYPKSFERQMHIGSLYAYTMHKEIYRENRSMSYTKWGRYPEKRKAGERSSLHSQKNGMVLPKKRDDIPGDLLHDYSGIYGWGEHNRK